MSMSIQLEPNLHHLDECVALLYLHANGFHSDEYITTFCEKHNVQREEVEPLFAEQIEISDYVISRLDLDDETLQRFFGKIGEEDGTCIAAEIFLPVTNVDVATYAQKLLAHSPAERLRFLAQKIHGDLEGRMITDEEADAVGSVDELMRRILQSREAPKDQLALIDLCLNTDAYIRQISALLEKAIPLFKQKEHLISARVQAHRQTLAAIIAQKGRGIMDEYLTLPNESDGLMHVYVSVMMSRSIRYTYNPEAEEFIFYGINVEALSALSEQQLSQDEDASAILKILGDKTKQDILRTLRTRPLYGQELATQLNLSTATISYHMNLLLQHNLVLVERENTRIYYRINQKGVVRQLDKIRAFLGV